MAISPREELRIIQVVAFRLGDDKLWHWDLDALDGIREEFGPGHHKLTEAILDYLGPAKSDPNFSKIVTNGDEYHLRRYAFGAPDPFDFNDPMALAEVGYIPPGIEE